jgi:hypothetical protein
VDGATWADVVDAAACKSTAIASAKYDDSMLKALRRAE